MLKLNVREKETGTNETLKFLSKKPISDKSPMFKMVRTHVKNGSSKTYISLNGDDRNSRQGQISNYMDPESK